MSEVLELKATVPGDVGIVRSEIEETDGDRGNEMLCSLSEAEQERLRVLQALTASANRRGYGKRQEAVAQKLGLTVRSVRRLVRQLREGGGNSLIRRSRSDRGAARIGEERQRFIVKTYRDGNCGSRRLRPAQVAVGVKVRAQELGTAV